MLLAWLLSGRLKYMCEIVIRYVSMRTGEMFSECNSTATLYKLFPCCSVMVRFLCLLDTGQCWAAPSLVRATLRRTDSRYASKSNCQPLLNPISKNVCNDIDPFWTTCFIKIAIDMQWPKLTNSYAIWEYHCWVKQLFSSSCEVTMLIDPINMMVFFIASALFRHFFLYLF